MTATQTFRELTYTMRPQDPHGDGTGLRFATGEHGGDYPDNMPQAITVTDAQGRWAVYVPSWRQDRGAGAGGSLRLRLGTMCGRFVQRYTWDEIQDLYELPDALPALVQLDEVLGDPR